MPEGGLRFIIILTNYDDLVLGNLLTQYEVPAAGSFREVQNVEICRGGMPPISRRHTTGEPKIYGRYM